MRKLVLAMAALAVGSVALADGGDAPEISRSVGRSGGIVVLWPRVIPADDAFTDEAVAVQQKLKTIAAEAANGLALDVRPSPERVCPRGTGCKAVTLSAVIVHKDKGCALVATVSGPGQSDATLVPWAGKLKLLQNTAKFREPPEDQIQVVDFSKCDAFLKEADVQRVKLIEAVRQAVSAKK